MEGRFSKLSSILTVAFLAVIFGGFFLLKLVTAAPDIIRSERRIPAALPELSVKNVFSAEFMRRFDSYATDNYPMRENLRTLHAACVFGLFFQSDKDGLYTDAYGAGAFTQVDVGAVEQTANMINTVVNRLDGAGMNVYYSIIPEKSFYSDRYLPGYDHRLAECHLKDFSGFEGYTYIDITGALNAESFYRTDFHWDQARIGAVVDTLCEAMGFDMSAGTLLEQPDYAGEFSGVYAGQTALPIGTDSIMYFPCPSVNVMYLNAQTMEFEPGQVYKADAFSGLDAYDFFLSGIQSLVVLENQDADTDRELYIFRDSFSSSLAPLLAGAYSKVVLVDLRYLSMSSLKRLIGIKPGSDVLFLYSTRILNDPTELIGAFR